MFHEREEREKWAELSKRERGVECSIVARCLNVREGGGDVDPSW